MDVRVERFENRRWTEDHDLQLYDGVDPLPGIYGTVEDAESEARRLLGLQGSFRPIAAIASDGA